MLLNELAQWAVLGFVSVFLLGLTRQLGNFLVPSRERLAHDTGPRVGKRLSTEILPAHALERLQSLIRERGAGWGSVLVVSDDCPGCEGLVERLSRDGAPDGTPIAFISRASSPEHQAVLEQVGDVAVVDPKRLKAASIGVTPFAFLVDESLKIVHKQIAWDLADVAYAWSENGRGYPGPKANGNNGNGHRAEPLSLTHVGGGDA